MLDAALLKIPLDSQASLEGINLKAETNPSREILRVHVEFAVTSSGSEVRYE